MIRTVKISSWLHTQRVQSCYGFIVANV